MKTVKGYYISDIREIERDLYRNGNSSIPKFVNKEGVSGHKIQNFKQTPEQELHTYFLLTQEFPQVKFLMEVKIDGRLQLVL